MSFNYVDPIAGTRPKDDQGTYDRAENLTVTFDPAKIDALLVSLGDQPWPGPRPVLVPMLSVHARKPPNYLLSADENLAAEQRAAFERLASEAGIELRFPVAAEFLNAVAPSCGTGKTFIVRGTLDWSEAALGWVGEWRTCRRGHEHVWSIRGVGYDQAFENLIEGMVVLAAGHGSPKSLPNRQPRPDCARRPFGIMIRQQSANREDRP